MKQFRMTLTALALAGMLAVPAFAAVPTGSYPISVDGAATEATSCVMVPLRTMAESLGFTVTWTGSSALVDNGVMHTEVIPGVDRYTVTTSNPHLVGMSAPFSLGVPPYAVDGVTYVPLGLFDALLGSREGAVTVTDGQISIQTDREGAQIPNPFTDCATLEEAAKTAGFSMTLPEGGYTFQVMPGHMIQASGDGLTIRKGVGSDDISGDYTSYPQTGTRTVNGLSLTWKGENDWVRVATWSKGDYTFSVSSETGLTMAELTALAGSVG